MQDKLEQAKEHHQAGRLHQAYALYREVIAADTGNLEAIYHYGNLVRRVGTPEAARDIFAQALKLAPDEPLLHASMGEIHRDLGQQEQAIKSFFDAVRLNPADFASLTNLGVIYQRRGELDRACEVLRQAVRARDDFSPALNNLGIVLHRLGHQRGRPELIDEAIEILTRATEIDPNNANAAANLAAAYLRLKKYDAAGKCSLRALGINPKQLVALDALSASLVAVREFTQARDILEIAVGHYPGEVRLWQRLAGIYYQEKQYYEAIQAFKQIAALRPDDMKPQLVLGSICNEVSQFEDAVAAFRRAIELGANYPSPYQGLGQALARLDRIDEARAAMEKGLSLNPEDETMRFAVAALADEAVDTAPEAYVTKLFDGFAAHFDEQLLEGLEYRTPELLSEAVRRVLEQGERKLTVVDLGCGTGLCGPHFRDISGRLVGTDLSPKMIEKARERGGYDELRAESLEETLGKADQDLDLAIAADVFVYIGDLDPVFAAARLALKPRGLFAFSIEVTEDESFSVGTTFRFSHSHAYMSELARRHGFEVLIREAAILRKESGKPVEGAIYVLRGQ
ncbi:MAG: tetratricopeptide repeat protein [Sphingomonadales bacterium]